MARNKKSKAKGATAKAKRPNPARKKTSTKNMVEAQSRDAAYQRALKSTDPLGRQMGELVFQRTYIDKGLLAKEALLLHTRWVGNRYMSPVQATQAFTEAYIAAYRAAWARHFDLSEGQHKQPCAPSLALNDRSVITSLWQARQKADELGMPYDLFCEIVLDRWLSGRKAKQPPLPNQLLSGKLFDAWMRGHPTWAEASERLYLPVWDRRFFMEPSSEDPVHAAAMRALRADVLHAKDRPAQLARYLGAGGPLTEARAKAMFEADMVRDALATVAVPATVTDAPEGYVPACLGNRNDVRDMPCHSCPFVAQCSGVKRKVTRALHAAGSSGDPRADRRREQNRDSQRRHREKKQRQSAA
ncbi:bZIP transcription factor [Stenotrophomonas maltophilia]|uniref:bZIP transcription factor n=1 Tax=Stenotrophomonas maltophilia TaxID=40324 RepID=UPI0004EF4FDF|nr:bZIP transcription factor [Stenotrophomonas maltophilia]AIL06466.1 hypothetical protein DP16_1327 [Stenotrophomonas maltophilia]MCU1065065.1 bZIP transcription factor [Stenotrophomonas maltophilia]QQA83881.1 bZIP transcription factor [Stenotrophomonas maltophilia]WQE25088.1 bZIP transcription factor [Stenotrophomonas maltophilia]SNW07484.1 Uncharacterised protein [Stenotrophomonas maltophilia]